MLCKMWCDNRGTTSNGSGATAFRPFGPRRAFACWLTHRKVPSTHSVEQRRREARGVHIKAGSPIPTPSVVSASWGSNVGHGTRGRTVRGHGRRNVAPAHPLAMLLFPSGVWVAASIGAIPRKMSLSGSGCSHSEKGLVVWQGRNGVADGVWTLGRSRGPSWRGVYSDPRTVGGAGGTGVFLTKRACYTLERASSFGREGAATDTGRSPRTRSHLPSVLPPAQSSNRPGF